MGKNAVVKLINTQETYNIGFEGNVLYFSKSGDDTNGVPYLCRIRLTDEKECQKIWKFFKKQKWYAGTECPDTYLNFSSNVMKYGSNFCDAHPLVCVSDNVIFIVFQNNIIWEDKEDKTVARSSLLQLVDSTKKKTSYLFDYVPSVDDEKVVMKKVFNDYIEGAVSEKVFLDAQSKMCSYTLPSCIKTKRNFINEKPEKLK